MANADHLLKWSRVSKAGVLLSPQMQEMALHHHQLQHHHHLPDGSHYNRNQALINSSPPILPNPMSALTQLNLQVSRGALPHGSPSPPGSKSATPSPSSSNQEEEAEAHLKVLMRLKDFCFDFWLGGPNTAVNNGASDGRFEELGSFGRQASLLLF